MTALQNFLIYIGSSMLNKALPLLLLPILTHYLTPEQYGVLAMYMTYVSFALPFVTMNIQGPLTQVFFSQDRDAFGKAVFNASVLMGLNAFLWTSLILAFFKQAHFISGISSAWLLTVPFVSFCIGMNNIQLVNLRNEKKPFSFALVENLNTVINLSLSLLFVIGLRMGWEGRGYAVVVTSVLFAALAAVMLYRNGCMRTQLDFTNIKRLFIVSFPLIFYGLSGMIIFLSDRLFIDKMVGKHAVGIYATAVSIASVVHFVKDALMKTVNPHQYEHLNSKDPNGKLLFVRQFYLVSAGLVLVAGLVTIVGTYMTTAVLNERYRGCTAFIGWLAFGFAINGMYGLLVPVAVYKSHSRNLAIIMAFGAVLNLGANYLLIKRFGAIGAAQATAFALAVSFLVNWAYSMKIHDMPWFSKKIFSRNI